MAVSGNIAEPFEQGRRLQSGHACEGVRPAAGKPNAEACSSTAIAPAEGADTGHFEIVVIRDLATLRDPIASRHACWARLCNHPEAHPETFAAVCAANADLIRPHVLQIIRDGQVVAMGIARIQREPISTSFGLARTVISQSRVVRLSYRGIIGDSSPVVMARLLDQLAEPLRSGEASALCFDHIEFGSMVHEWCRTPPPPLMPDWTPDDIELHWSSDVSGSFAAFLSRLPARERRRIVNRDNKVRRTFGERVRVESYRSADALARIMADTTAVSSLTYQQALGHGIDDLPWFAPLISSALDLGMARCFVLYIDGVPRAFFHGLVWRRAFHAVLMGYDPAMAPHGLGRYVMHRAIEAMCNDADIDRLDFGLGHADYKRRLADCQRMEVQRYVFARTPASIGVNSLRAAVARVERWSDRAVKAVGFRETLKEMWRSRYDKRAR